MFLVKREESRDFNVFFGCFLVFGREKKRKDQWGKRQVLEKCVFPCSGVCLGLFIALSALFEAAANIGPLVAFQWPPTSNGS